MNWTQHGGRGNLQCIASWSEVPGLAIQYLKGQAMDCSQVGLITCAIWCYLPIPCPNWVKLDTQLVSQNWLLSVWVTPHTCWNWYQIPCTKFQLHDWIVFFPNRKYSEIFQDSEKGKWSWKSQATWLQAVLQAIVIKTVSDQIRSDQLLSRVRLFVTPWIPARQASLSITNSRRSLRLTSIESVMPSSHLILCRPLLLLPPVPPSIRVFSNESTLRMRWPKYWSMLLAKNRNTDQWNRIECPKINPHNYGQPIYNKGGNNIQWREDSLFNDWHWENWTAKVKEWN